jgi:hypothetical protein
LKNTNEAMEQGLLWEVIETPIFVRVWLKMGIVRIFYTLLVFDDIT